MSSTATVEKIQFFSDSRGWVIEPIAEKLLSAQRIVRVVLAEPWGAHHHKLLIAQQEMADCL